MLCNQENGNEQENNYLQLVKKKKSSLSAAQKTSVSQRQSGGSSEVTYGRVIVFSTFAGADLIRSLGYCFDNGE